MSDRYSDIADKARYIALWAGDWHSNAEEAESVFKEDELTIEYYSREFDSVIVKVAGRRVLDYTFNKISGGKIAIEGEWPKVIETIYDNIELFINKKNERDEERKRKTRDLNGLQECYDFLVECLEQDPELYSTILNDLNNKDIKLVEVRSGQNKSLKVLFKEKTVMEFRDQSAYRSSDGKGYDFDSMSDYVANYKPGEWNESFCSIIYLAKQTKKERDAAVVAEKTGKLLEKLKGIN